jgi:hypothetical protein
MVGGPKQLMTIAITPQLELHLRFHQLEPGFRFHQQGPGLAGGCLYLLPQPELPGELKAAELPELLGWWLRPGQLWWL